jgi:hypothetical protein
MLVEVQNQDQDTEPVIRNDANNSSNYANNDEKEE